MPFQEPHHEPWLRGDLADVPAVGRAVLHALQLAEEDLRKWCGEFSDAEVNSRPGGLASVAFHLRHIARSIDRLLTYAEGRGLNERQATLLKTEMDPGARVSELFEELDAAFRDGAMRVQALAHENLEEARTVGKNQLPTMLGGLLVHVADHTQRHVGQAIVTAKLVGQMQSAR